MALRSTEAQIRELVLGSGAEGEAAAPEVPADLFADELPSPLWEAAEKRGIERRRGRPQGSRNRGSEDVVRYLAANHRPALLSLQDVIDLGPVGIRQVFGLKPVDAFDQWRKCVVEMLPYQARKQPQELALPVGGEAVPILVLASMPVDPRLAGGNPPSAGDGALDVTDFTRVERNQPLSLRPLHEVPDESPTDPD